MKLLVVCQNYKPEPFNTAEICEELVAHGHQVTVLTGLPNYPESVVPDEYRHGRHGDEMVDGVRVVRVPIVARGSGLNKMRRVANAVSFPLMAWLMRAAMDARYDCVVSFEFSPIFMCYPALRIARKQGIPCLMWVVDLWPEDLLTGGFSREGTAYRLLRGMSKRIYARADRLAVTSPKFVDYLRDELRLDVSPDWLPQYAEDMFVRMGGSSHVSRACDDTIFTFAGNVGGNQAVETIVRAAALVHDSRVRVRIVGSGSRLADCQALARELRADNLEFLGRRPLEDMPKVYGESDAMLLTLAKPTNGSLVPVYTIPRKFQSYIAAGKPVLCAADGYVGEAMAREGCGIACAAEDAEALAAAMDAFTAMDSEKREAMAKRARTLYQERYSRPRFFEELEGILKELTQGADER